MGTFELPTPVEGTAPRDFPASAGGEVILGKQGEIDSSFALPAPTQKVVAEGSAHPTSRPAQTPAPGLRRPPPTKSELPSKAVESTSAAREPTRTRPRAESKAAQKAEARTQGSAAILAGDERKPGRENLRRGAILGGALLAMAVVAAVFISTRGGDEVMASDPGSSSTSLVVGDGGAPHNIVIYQDFLCFVCGVFEGVAGEDLAKLADAGEVVIEYRPISILGFGPYSADAVNAFFVVQDAAGDEVAKEFYDLLFADQPSEKGPFPDADWLVDKAVKAGADEADVRQGIERGEKSDNVEAANKQSEGAGVQGIPTVLLDGEPFFRRSVPKMASDLVNAVSP